MPVGVAGFRMRVSIHYIYNKVWLCIPGHVSTAKRFNTLLSTFPFYTNSIAHKSVFCQDPVLKVHKRTGSFLAILPIKSATCTKDLTTLWHRHSAQISRSDFGQYAEGHRPALWGGHPGQGLRYRPPILQISKVVQWPWTALFGGLYCDFLTLFSYI